MTRLGLPESSRNKIMQWQNRQKQGRVVIVVAADQDKTTPILHTLVSTLWILRYTCAWPCADVSRICCPPQGPTASCRLCICSEASVCRMSASTRQSYVSCVLCLFVVDLFVVCLFVVCLLRLVSPISLVSYVSCVLCLFVLYLFVVCLFVVCLLRLCVSESARAREREKV